MFHFNVSFPFFSIFHPSLVFQMHLWKARLFILFINGNSLYSNWASSVFIINVCPTVLLARSIELSRSLFLKERLWGASKLKGGGKKQHFLFFPFLLSLSLSLFFIRIVGTALPHLFSPQLIDLEFVVQVPQISNPSNYPTKIRQETFKKGWVSKTT